MSIKKVFLPFILLFILFTGSLNASDLTDQEPLYDQARQLFESGDFKRAGILFQRLLSDSPEDHLLNYYYGASLTEIGHYSADALNKLEQSLEGNPPAKVHYYLGLQYQAHVKWDQAIRHFNQFRIKALEAEANELNIAEKIQQCLNHENPYTVTEVNGPRLDEISVNITEEPAPAPAVIEKGKPIEFRINNQISYMNSRHFRTELGKELFMKADQLQQELSSKLQQANQLRNKYQQTEDPSQKQAVGENILALENELYEIKDQVAHLLNDSRILEADYWQNAGREELDRFRAELKATVTEQEPDSAPEIISDSTLIIDPAVLLESAETAPTQSTTDSELTYKVQIGAYSRNLPPYVDKLFKKLSYIRKIDNYTDEKGVVVYTTGNLKNLEDAVKLRDQVRQEGVEDAFVVPYFKGKRITLEQAKKIEAEL